jgi:hypothetical protein
LRLKINVKLRTKMAALNRSASSIDGGDWPDVQRLEALWSVVLDSQ